MNETIIDIDIEQELKKINQLVAKGSVVQAHLNCKAALLYNQRHYGLRIKDAYLYELQGLIKQPELLYINICKDFPHHFDAKVTLVNFYIRANQLIKAKETLHKLPHQFHYYKKFRELNIRLLYNFQDYEKVEKEIEQYIKLHPNEFFGYFHLTNVVAQVRSSDCRDKFKEIIKRVEHKPFADKLRNRIDVICRKYISSRNRIRQGVTNNNPINLLHSNVLFKHKDLKKSIDETFKRQLSFSDIKTLFSVANLNKEIEQNLVQYINKNERWKNYKVIKNKLDVIETNVGRLNNETKLKPLTDNNIDIVYAWCDISDATFRDKLSKFTNFDNAVDDLSNNEKRYQQIGEIKLSLLSIQKYFSSVRNIFIVTNKQTFDTSFLSASFQKKIIFVDHKTIFPSSLQQKEVFNSNLIETFIWKIKDLSECFIYLNDDTILGDFLDKSLIVNKANVPYSTTVPEDLALYKRADDLVMHSSNTSYYITCLNNANNQFINKFNVLPQLGPLHQIMILQKQACKEAYEIFSKEWETEFYKDLVRGNKSVYSLLVYNWYALLKGYQILGPYHIYKGRSLYFSNEIYKENVEMIKLIKPLFYCLNYISDDTSKQHLTELINTVAQ